MLVKQQHQTILEIQSNETLRKTQDLKSNISWWKKHYSKVKKKKKAKGTNTRKADTYVTSNFTKILKVQSIIFQKQTLYKLG